VNSVNVGTPPRAFLYANFGVTRRELGQQVGWWGRHSHHYGGDTELSLRIWRLGYSVLPLTYQPNCFIRHYRAQDQTRIENDGEGRKLGRRWAAWDGLADRDKELLHGA
jgi:GT2 family glycosyltransferase